MSSSFEDFDIPKDVLKGIYFSDYDTPSAIQCQTFRFLPNNDDLIIQSNSGTGKTLAYLVYLFSKTTKDDKAFIVAPTRELCKQIYDCANLLNEYTNFDINCLSDDKYIERAQIFIGTPGCIASIRNKQVKTIVIDECDEIETNDMKAQLQKIITNAHEAQKIFVSATMTNTLVSMKCIKILLKDKDVKNDDIRHVRIDCVDDKIEKIVEIYSKMIVEQCIIFVNKLDTCDFVYKKLKKRRFSVFRLHSKLSDKERKQVFNKFKAGRYKTLICTDIISRGIDLNTINLVINYNIPKFKEDYIHRVGRGGRYGRKCTAINLVDSNEKKRFKNIVETYNIKLEDIDDNK